MFWKIDTEAFSTIVDSLREQGYSVRELAAHARIDLATFRRLLAGRSLASNANMAKLRVIWPHLPARKVDQVLLVSDSAHAREGEDAGA